MRIFIIFMSLMAFNANANSHIRTQNIDDISNLIVQPYFGKCNARQKDVLENKLHSLICKREIPVQEAQDILYNDWKSGYTRFIDEKGCDK